MAYRPFGLGLFDDLVTVCNRVRTELDRRLTEAARRAPALPALDTTTHAGRFVQQLTGRTTSAELAEAMKFHESDDKRLSFLADVVERHRRGTAAAEAERLRRLADRGDRLKAHVDRVAALVSTVSRDELARLRDDAATKADAARVARTQALSKAVLPGVGESAWRSLWEAARAYSSSVAYPGQSFPVTTDTCLLCQQPLGSAAADRLEAFESFVQTFTEKAANAAAAAYQEAIRNLEETQVSQQTFVELIEDLRTSNEGTADAIAGYLAAAQMRIADLVKALSDRTETSLTTFPVAPTGQLTACLNQLRTQANELVPNSTDAVESLSTELAELRARKALSAASEAVAAQHRHLLLQEQIGTAKSTTSTYAITQKGAELTREALTEVLVDRFSRETDRLGLEKVVLKTVGGRRGVLLYRTGFAGAMQDAPLPEVLSEGEQTALGMAGFLPKCGLTPQSRPRSSTTQSVHLTMSGVTRLPSGL